MVIGNNSAARFKWAGAVKQDALTVEWKR